jgi:hypothetical protein
MMPKTPCSYSTCSFDNAFEADVGNTTFYVSIRFKKYKNIIKNLFEGYEWVLLQF